MDNIRYKAFSLGSTDNKGWWEDAEGNFFVKGYYSDSTPDRIGDIIEKDASIRAVARWRKWGNVRGQHDETWPVGKVKLIGEEDGLAWNQYVAKIVDQKAKELVKEGVLSATSIGLIPIEYEPIDLDEVDYGVSPLAKSSWLPPIRIKEYELVEFSLVDNPMHESAVLGENRHKFTMFKMSQADIESLVAQREEMIA